MHLPYSSGWDRENSSRSKRSRSLGVTRGHFLLTETQLADVGRVLDRHLTRVGPVLAQGVTRVDEERLVGRRLARTRELERAAHETRAPALSAACALTGPTLVVRETGARVADVRVTWRVLEPNGLEDVGQRAPELPGCLLSLGRAAEEQKERRDCLEMHLRANEEMGDEGHAENLVLRRGSEEQVRNRLGVRGQGHRTSLDADLLTHVSLQAIKTQIEFK